MNQITLFLATLGPVGRNLPAPGTCGSLAGILIFIILVQLTGLTPHMITLGCVPLFLLGVPLCRRAEILLDSKDPKEVIWDEFIVIPFIFWPLAAEITGPLTQSTFIWIGAGFLLFRFFDISKPLIIHHSQRLPRGWGVMVDDLLAALASSVILWLAKTFSLSFVG
jgi:phosphatidylglycerophosphatase A